jgi:predicted membrane protein
MNFRLSNFVWGMFLLLAAAFVLLNQFEDFVHIGTGSLIAAILSLFVIVICMVHLRFALLPVPLAILYIIFQTPLELPYIKVWPLLLASVFVSIGLSIMLPKKRRNYQYKFKHSEKSEGIDNKMRKENGNDNNPFVTVNFGGISRSLCSDSLETAQLNCSFGSLDVFFDKTTLSPNGAVVNMDCSFGAIKLFIPKGWQIIDQVRCTLGGVEMDKNFTAPAENAPRLTLTGSVSFGGLEIRYI